MLFYCGREMNVCKMSRIGQKQTKKTAEVIEMVENAIRSLKEPGGSFLRVIKKYVAANYNVHAETLSPAIEEYLKAAVASGRLLQPTGRGANGSFKLAAMKSAISARATTQCPGRRRSSGRKRKEEKKQPVAKHTRLQSKLALKTPRNSPSKAEKVTKIPTKNPKAP